jgi:hypothetical protein
LARLAGIRAMPGGRWQAGDAGQDWPGFGRWQAGDAGQDLASRPGRATGGSRRSSV